MASTERCENCNAPTENPENEYGEFVCEDCLQSAFEYERHQEFLMSGDTPTFRETYLAAYEQKRALK